MKLIKIPFLALLVFSVGCSTLQQEYDKQKTVIRNQKILINQLTETNAFIKRKNAQLEAAMKKNDLSGQYSKSISQLERDYQARMKKLMSALNGMNLNSNSSGIVSYRTDGATMIRLPNKILFRSGASDLSTSGKTVLRQIVGTIQKQYPNNKIRIEGHTDKQPILKSKKRYTSNWDLSATRATRVVEYLVSQKTISPSRLSTAGYSKYRPISTKDSLNRRVEIAILDNK